MSKEYITGAKYYRYDDFLLQRLIKIFLNKSTVVVLKS